MVGFINDTEKPEKEPKKKRVARIVGKIFGFYMIFCVLIVTITIIAALCKLLWPCVFLPFFSMLASLFS